jgi:hypothetical protein
VVVDFVKMVLKHPPSGIGADEQVLAVTTLLPRASIIRAEGYSAAGGGGVIGMTIGEAVRGRMADKALEAAGEPVGDAATWPSLDNVALVLTGRRLILYDANKGLRKLQGPIGEYALDRLSGISFEKKALMNVVRIAFADGSVREADSAKGQRLEEFIEALGRAKAG